ncbi:Spy/CpxP family protein refolding chaperone, partial [Calditrichota bacterium]
LIILTIALVTGSTFAQKGKMAMKDQSLRGPRQEHFPKIPDLTDEQKEQIKELKTDHLKATLPLKNQLHEKETHLQTVSTGDNVNLTTVNKIIDEISAIKTQLAKSRAAHRQQIRKILTDEQRVIFDSHPKGKSMGDGPPMQRPMKRMHDRDRF